MISFKNFNYNITNKPTTTTFGSKWTAPKELVHSVLNDAALGKNLDIVEVDELMKTYAIPGEELSLSVKNRLDAVALRKKLEMEKLETLMKAYTTNSHSGLVNPIDVLPEIANKLNGSFNDFIDSLDVLNYIGNMYKKAITSQGKELTKTDLIRIDNKVVASKRVIPEIVKRMRQGDFKLIEDDFPKIQNLFKLN